MRRRRLRCLSALLGAGVVAATLGCSAGDTAEAPDVLTTFTVLADIASNVAGGHLTVASLTKPGAEIHGYEPTPGDVARAAGARLILDNGLGLEAWFARFVDGLDVPHVVVSDGVTPLDITEDAYAGKPNPHAWMSPLNVGIYADNIAAAMADLDPVHAADYHRNAAAYRDRLHQVHDDLLTALADVPPGQRRLVTCEGAFAYLARDAGLTEHYIWAVNAEQQATPRRVAAVIDAVAAHDVPAVFCESTVSAAPMHRVAEDTGARFGGVLYVDSLSGPGGPVPTYLDLIRHDAATIAAGLTAGRDA